MFATSEISIRAGDMNLRRQYAREVKDEAEALALFDQAKAALLPIFDPPDELEPDLPEDTADE